MKAPVRERSGARSRSVHATVVLTPLVDTLLAIVLLHLAAFHAPNDLSIPRRLRLPRADNVRALAESPAIVLDRSGTFVDGVPADGLRELLRHKRELSRGTHVTILAERNVPAGRLKAVLADATSVGYREIAFGVERR